MEQYIPKSALVAEIENKINKYTKRGEESDAKRDGHGMYWGDVISCLNEIRSSLDTLEVKEEIEVDLKKEINDYFNAWQNVQCDEDCCNEGGFCCVLDENVKLVDIERCRKVAKHFFELGLKARKEE